MKLAHILESDSKTIDSSTLTDQKLAKVLTRMKKHIRNGEVGDINDAAQYSIDDFYDSGIVFTDDDNDKLVKRIIKLFQQKHGTFKQNAPK